MGLDFYAIFIDDNFQSRQILKKVWTFAMLFWKSKKNLEEKTFNWRENLKNYEKLYFRRAVSLVSACVLQVVLKNICILREQS